MNLESTTKLLEFQEGFRERPYLDTTGHVTIGYGDNLTAKYGDDLQSANERFPNGLSQSDAEISLKGVILAIASTLNTNLSFYSKLDDVRQAVLISMCFNLGMKGLWDFKNTLDYIASHKFQLASMEMMKSKWAEQVPDRANMLSKMMFMGTWPNI